MRSERIELGSYILGGTYTRAQISEVGGVTRPVGPRDPYWSTGIVEFENAILLLVTLEKDEEEKKYAYRDYFNGTLFFWQSQNRHHQDSALISDIRQNSRKVLLFARRRARTAFSYCGLLNFQDMRGERPVTIEFQALDYISENAPPSLREIYDWRPAKSAAEIDPERIVELAIRRETGQGHEANPALRRALELYGMDRAKLHYSEQGFHVADTSANRPYDLECTRGNERRRVEVKATQSRGHKVLVTVGEVKAALDPTTVTDLFILHSIKAMLAGPSPVVTDGEIRLISDWRPDAGDLDATVFNYRLSQSDLAQ